MAAVLFGGSVEQTRVAVRDVPPLSLAVLRYGLGRLLLELCLLFGTRLPHRPQWPSLWASVETIAAMRAHPGPSEAMSRLLESCEEGRLGTDFVEATADEAPLVIWPH